MILLNKTIALLNSLEFRSYHAIIDMRVCLCLYCFLGIFTALLYVYTWLSSFHMWVGISFVCTFIRSFVQPYLSSSSIACLNLCRLISFHLPKNNNLTWILAFVLICRFFGCLPQNQWIDAAHIFLWFCFVQLFSNNYYSSVWLSWCRTGRRAVLIRSGKSLRMKTNRADSMEK